MAHSVRAHHHYRKPNNRAEQVAAQTLFSWLVGGVLLLILLWAMFSTRPAGTIPDPEPSTTPPAGQTEPVL